jgi:hypothetical protein
MRLECGRWWGWWLVGRESGVLSRLPLEQNGETEELAGERIEIRYVELLV